MLAETVIIGYGSAKKRDLTGSITNIKGSEIANKTGNQPVIVPPAKDSRCTDRQLRTSRCRSGNTYPRYELHQWLQNHCML